MVLDRDSGDLVEIRRRRWLGKKKLKSCGRYVDGNRFKSEVERFFLTTNLLKQRLRGAIVATSNRITTVRT